MHDKRALQCLRALRKSPDFQKHASQHVFQDIEGMVTEQALTQAKDVISRTTKPARKAASHEKAAAWDTVREVLEILLTDDAFKPGCSCMVRQRTCGVFPEFSDGDEMFLEMAGTLCVDFSGEGRDSTCGARLACRSASGWHGSSSEGCHSLAVSVPWSLQLASGKAVEAFWEQSLEGTHVQSLPLELWLACPTSPQVFRPLEFRQGDVPWQLCWLRADLLSGLRASRQHMVQGRRRPRRVLLQICLGGLSDVS